MPRRPTPSPASVLTALKPGRRRFLQGSLAVAAVGPLLAPRGARGAGTVNVYNWDTYIGEDTLAEFTEATGTEVRYDLFASNDELFAKLREGNPGYDVIFPTNNMLSRMIKAEIVQPLDHARLPNMANLEPRFQDPAFDPGRRYSLPYFWGTIGIGYRVSALDAPPDSWKILLDSDEQAGLKCLLNDNAMIYVALKYLGHSLNATDPRQIDEAAQLLIRAKPNLQSFVPDTGQDLLLSQEVTLAEEYNGDILQVMAEDDDLSYTVPREGSEVWEDTMAIPTGAPNVENAHAFINFILDGRVHAAIAEEVRYACPNAAAKALLPKEDLDNPALYPPADVIERCEPRLYVSEEAESLYSAAVTRVLAA